MSGITCSVPDTVETGTNSDRPRMPREVVKWNCRYYANVTGEGVRMLVHSISITRLRHILPGPSSADLQRGEMHIRLHRIRYANHFPRALSFSLDCLSDV